MLAAGVALAAGQAWHPAENPAPPILEWSSPPQGWRPGEPDSSPALQPMKSVAWAQSGDSIRGMRWYRAQVRIDAPVDSLDPLFLRHFALPRAQEFWWDGERLGSNGMVAADAAGERPGRLLATVRIPHRLSAPGGHELAILVSNQGGLTGGRGEVRIGRLKALQLATHIQSAFTAFLVGVFVITAVFQFVNFLASIRRGYGLFSIFCAGCTLYLIPQQLGLYLGADTDGMRLQLLAGAVGWSIMMTTLPLFFLGEFLPRARAFHLAAFALAALPSFSLIGVFAGALPSGAFRYAAPANTALGLLAVAVSLGAAAWGLRKRIPGAAPAAWGLACLLAGVVASNVIGTDHAWGLGLAALILFQNASLSRQWQARGLEQKETQLRASRLEIELLKKNIQPHFLLHSLRSITDLLLKDPKAAARLVNALAGELRMMLKMTHEKAIPLAEEIRLCRSHLEVLSLRGGRILSLEEAGDSGTDRDLAIPPMALHTLLEQGLEEAAPETRAIRFRLEVEAGSALRLRLSHDAPRRPPSLQPPEETGLRYVRARLEEAFPGRWRLAAAPEDGAPWSVEIRIEQPAVPART